MGFNFRPPERRVWKVRDLVAAVRSHIEREYSDAWVEGEISNFRAPDSGHLYFTPIRLDAVFTESKGISKSFHYPRQRNKFSKWGN